MWVVAFLQTQYQVSDERKEICETIGIAGEDALVLGADMDIIRALRRINPYTKVIYGTDIEASPENYNTQTVCLYNYMQEMVIPLDLVIDTAEELGVNYLVLHTWAGYTIPVTEYQMEGTLNLIGETENYWVFYLKSNSL